jgi:hypothetical protein
MAKYDDHQFRPTLGRIKARGGGRSPFISRVVKASNRAGNVIGRPRTSVGKRPGAKLGRGHVAARFAGATLGPRARRVVIKTRLVVAKRSCPRSTERHLRYIQRDGVTREGGGGELNGPFTDGVDARALDEPVSADRH